MSNVLKVVKETFNIFNDGRKQNPAPQKFLLSALASVLNSPATKERIRLNEAIGYYGHRLRELTGKIRPTEVELVEKNGKVAAVNVVPAIRTKSISVDDKGNVTHEQEFLDTDPGRAALACYKSGSGGFSWAMSGTNGHNTEQGSVTKQFSGFDFVQQPNFIPLHRQSMLLSSLGTDSDSQLLSSMKEQGLEGDKAVAMLQTFKEGPAEEGQLNDILLSSLIEEKEKRDQLLSGVIDDSPFLINEAQRNAILNCSTSNDVEILNALFSAMQNTDLSHLPNNFDVKVKTPTQAADINYHRFDGENHFKFS